MTALVEYFNYLFGFLDQHSIKIVAAMQATFCAGCAYQIVFRYKQGDASYHWLTSVCEFALASLWAQQWLSIVGRVLWYGYWPVVSLQNTLLFGVLFVLLIRAKGNVSKMFYFGENKRVTQ